MVNSHRIRNIKMGVPTVYTNKYLYVEYNNLGFLVNVANFANGIFFNLKMHHFHCVSGKKGARLNLSVVSLTKTSQEV